MRCAAVEFKFSNFTSLLRNISAAAKVLLALYFGRGFTPKLV
jgi:hypothetical protein